MRGSPPVESVFDWPREYAEFFRLFNEGDYFEAHEVLEDLWVVEVAPLKNYYKGLIQAAVAICHWQRGNHSGARKLYLSGRRYLDPYPADFEGFALARFRADLDALFAPLAKGDGAPLLPPGRIPVLTLAGHPDAR